MDSHERPSKPDGNRDGYGEIHELFLDNFARELEPDSEQSASQATLQWEQTSSEDREIFTIIAKKRYPDDVEAQETFIRAAMLTEFSKQVLENMRRTVDEIRAADETPEEPIRIFAPLDYGPEAA